MRDAMFVLCGLATAAFVLAGAAPARHGVLSPLKVIELPLPAAERSIQQLTISEDSHVTGRTSGKDVNHDFAYSTQDKAFVSFGTVRRQRVAGSVNPAELQRLSNMIHIKLPQLGIELLVNGEGTLAVFNSRERTGKTLGPIAGTRPFEMNGYQVSRALILGDDGNVYTAGKDGFIFRYSPKTEKLEQLPARLPAVQGREPWASLDAAVLGADGLIYGGTFDGYLFTFNPKTQEVVNLGKPLRQQRIQGLAFSKGKLYGVGGEDEGLSRAFAFDPKARGFELGGTLKTTDGKIILDPVGAMVADKDGNIYLGTTGRLGNLYLWENK